jgi:transmembrane sensor
MTDQPKTSAAPATSGPASTDDIAMQWLMRISDPDAAVDVHVACAHWRAADPAHERAFAAAQRFWQRDELALALERSLHGPQSPAWRDSLRPFGLAMAAMLALAILAGGLYLLPQARHFREWAMADERAPLHAMASLRLEDGSQITLDAGAAIDVRYTRTERRLVLRRGTIVIDTMPDVARPMVIEGGTVKATVLGTRFLVVRGQDADIVTVQSGRVGVAARRTGEEVHLTAGQRVRVDAAGLSVVDAVDPNSVADYAAGWRSFDGVPLQVVLDEIGRYRWAPILLTDADLATLPVTARLQVAEPERAIGALLATMPLRRQEWPGGTLRIDRRR